MESRRRDGAIESHAVPRRRIRRPLLALLALLVALAVGYGIRATQSSHSSPRPTTTSTSTDSGGAAGASRSTAPTGTAETSLSALPPEAARTVRLIEQGGPFPYPRSDGVVFRNAERHLPADPDGYYHEYTVPTPGSSTRGARRIITGSRGEYYYTADHYESFVRVDVSS